MVFSVFQAIFTVMDAHRNEWMDYSAITAGVNMELIARHIHPKRSSTIDRAVRVMVQKKKRVVGVDSFIKIVQLESDGRGNFMLTH